MKLAYLELCGFRGYRKRLRLDFAEDFTIIDGRNGVGKSTIFDAIEFLLTGEISRYRDIKADRETVADYVWWTGKGNPPEARYVKAGFLDGDEVFGIRRTEFEPPDGAALEHIVDGLCDLGSAPQNPIYQLCSSSIIRDEQIAALSLDLSEAERYALLRDSLGASDARKWIERGAQLVSTTKNRLQEAQRNVTSLSSDLTAATRRVDDLRANLIADDVLANAARRAQAFTKSEKAVDQLAGPVREWIAQTNAEIEALRTLASQWKATEQARTSVPELGKTRDAAVAEERAATSLVEESRKRMVVPPSMLAQQARDLITLVNLGRQLGLRDGHCPLCGTGQEHTHYEQGIAATEAFAQELDQRAAAEARNEQSVRQAEERLAQAQRSLAAAEFNLGAAKQMIQRFDALREEHGVSEIGTLEQLDNRVHQLRQSLEQAQRDLRVIDTIGLNAELENAKGQEARAKERLAAAEQRNGRARNAATVARALHDAARRAAGEALDMRLDRVLPLLSECYRRLRPHPVWHDIEYSIRGDVKKFLKLKVGDELNPQFLFSSGQRRATGLAFLLSVNLSLAWSRWRTIMLDDPVQHIDDFRTIHLAELAAQLVADDRQIICAVEDAALADLLCRRLPVRDSGCAKRVTMGQDNDGDPVISSELVLPVLPKRAFVNVQSAG